MSTRTRPSPLSPRKASTPNAGRITPPAAPPSPSPSPRTATLPDTQARRASGVPEPISRRLSGAPTVPGSPPAKSRARDLLRKHYGLGIGPPAPSGRPSDPMDLDSPAFDAKAYYEQLITTASLSTLLKRENELLSEIRELDGERQSLVYNHHHELIAASDTIAAMKTRAESLDADLDALRAAFSEISRLVPEVAATVDADTHPDSRSKENDAQR